ncbi:MAG: lamin tail domain-containing protein, partial [Verrucomicrobiota bacterium]
TSYDKDGSFPDFIELHNASRKRINLAGYSLSDEEKNPEKFVFGQDAWIEAGGFLVLEGGDERLGFALDGKGESVALYGPGSAEPIDEVSFGLQVSDQSISRIEGRWGLSEVTPGNQNVALLPGKEDALQISEWLALPSAASPQEFVEIRNRGRQSVSLDGLLLTDDPVIGGNPFPPLSFLGPEEVRVFGKRGKKGAGLEFGLSGIGDLLVLMDSEGRLIDHVSFGPQTAGVSQGRDEEGRLVFFSKPSPGEEESSMDGTDGLLLTEIHFHPAGKGDDEFLELTNTGNQSVSLGGLEFDRGIQFVFEKTAMLEPGASLVLAKERKAFTRSYGRKNVMGYYKGSLNNGGETLRLSRADGGVVFEIDFSDKWVPSADGDGYSMELRANRAEDEGKKGAWKRSAAAGGSPGTWN